MSDLSNPLTGLEEYLAAIIDPLDGVLEALTAFGTDDGGDGGDGGDDNGGDDNGGGE